MLGTLGQLWVTSAVKNEDVRNALLLCASLRQVNTFRKIAVITSLDISADFRKALHNGFDVVYYLDKDQNTTGLDASEFAKIYSIFVLQGHHNCAYLSPRNMAVKNCDDIFSHPTNSIRLLQGTTADTSAFVFAPSPQRFEMLIDELREGDDVGLYRLFQNCANINETQPDNLEEKFNIVLKTGGALLRLENEIAIVNFDGCTDEAEISDLEGTGLLGQLIGARWRKLQGQVLSWLNPSVTTSQHLKQKLRNYAYSNDPIAIVGMSCRLPSCNNLEEFWQLLFQGEDGTSKVPPFRWQKEQCSIHVADAGQTNAGFLKDPVDTFDAKFFGISPKEVLYMDPQHRLLHELVWEGLEDACIDPRTLYGSSGSVFIGPWINDYRHILEHFGNDEWYRSYMGNSIGAAAARISFLLGLTGPSIATESGCSSAMVALHLACRSLKTGETNVALACGVNLILNPVNQSNMPMIVSPDGHSKTFSADANGFGRAEGGGVLVLKRLSDALRNGDRVWGLVRGSAMSQEGVSKSMGTPTVHCESLAMKQALADANVNSHQVSYLEAHGTGTAVGDPLEVAAIAKSYKSEHRKEPLIIGSVKTNVGHTESCSGITGIIKVILAMHHEIIPAHINFTKLNPSIDLDAIPAVIPLERKQWKKIEDEPRIAGVSSFGITGTDVHVIVEEMPTEMCSKLLTMNVGDTERPLHIIKLSTKSEEAMSLLLDKYKNMVVSSEESIADIAYSANTGRADFPIRTAIIATNKSDICTAIDQRKFLKGEANLEKVGKICFLFTGQGSQYPGMAKQLFDTSLVFRIHFEYCEKILREMYNVSIMNVLWTDGVSCSSKDIHRTIYSQASIFCVEYALMKLWESWGVRPDYVLGHSLGEFAAAVCAGILSVEDAIELVAERSKLIDELPHGKMLVVRADEPQIDSAIKKFANDGEMSEFLDYAAVNSNQQTVVAGDSDVIMAFSGHCTESGLKCTVLDATHAFHSRHMDPMLEKYRTFAKAVPQQTRQKCEYISGMKGDLQNFKQMDAEYWVLHTRNQVKFMYASKKAVELGCRTFIEIGPQPVLSALTMMNNEDEKLLCVSSLKRNADDWSTLLTSLATLYINGVAIDWTGLDQFYARKKVRLPHYPFIRKQFWPDGTMQRSATSLQLANAIHPLVGYPLANATSLKIFQSELSLLNCTYIKDHRIGDKIIFPAAAYLEMCLVAGTVAIMGSHSDSLAPPSRPIKVENLIIKTPLAPEDSKLCQLQTVLESSFGNVWSDAEIKIFHRMGNSNSSASPWLHVAQASFSALLTADEHQQFLLEKENILLNKCWKNELLESFYEELELVGLNFGPMFKSLESECYDNSENVLLLKLKPLKDDQSVTKYICHPIILDAMLQAAIRLHQLNGSIKRGLHVPVNIGKFVWLPSGASKDNREFANDLFIKAYYGTNSSTSVLLNATGNALAFISQIEFIDTSVRVIESVLHHQINPMPELWEEVWRQQQVGHDRARLDLCRNAIESIKGSQVEAQLEKYNSDCAQIMKVFAHVNHLACISYLRALYECGWEPLLNQAFSEHELIRQLGIKMEFKKQVNYILRIIQEEGWIEQAGRETWRIVQVPPPQKQIQEEITSPFYSQVVAKEFRSTLLMLNIDKKLSKVLRGTEPLLSILFPEGESRQNEPSVAELYNEFREFVNFNSVFNLRNRTWLEKYKLQMSPDLPNKRSVFRILEIGAGTGGYTMMVLQMLEDLEVEYEYTYTDISTSFFPAAERKFETFAKRMKFKRLDIETDPIAQGFVPGYYDIVYAFDVVHATCDLKESLGNIRALLKPNGFLELWEMTRVHGFVTYIFGLLDGFWRFQDYHIRSTHCTISRGSWGEILEQTGFCVVGEYPCVNDHNTYICCSKVEDPDNKVSDERKNLGNKNSWLVFHQENEKIVDGLVKKFHQLARNRRVIFIQRGNEENITEANRKQDSFKIRPNCQDDFVQLMKSIDSETSKVEGILYCWSLDKTYTKQEDILRPYFFLVKSLEHLKTQKSLPELVTLLRKSLPLANIDFTGVCTSTLKGFTKSLTNENLELNCKCIDVGLQAADNDNTTLEIFYELWRNDSDVHMAFHENSRYVPKFIPLKQQSSTLELPRGVDRFQLVLPESKSIGDLKFAPLHPVSLQPEHIEIQVKASALNFRDVMTVLKPSDDFKEFTSVGLDYSGEVVRIGSQVTRWAVGDLVFGLNMDNAVFPSHFTKHQDDVMAVPKNFTFCEAATLPAVFITNYECLIELGKLTASDSVLIHAASGGVGLNAIDICKRVGATIFATAGSARKQNYLKVLGIQHIFNSRNTEYEKEILKATNGRGVDLVLNSLTGEGFKEATLKVCAQGARFFELGKLSIWTPQEVSERRPDVKYTIIDVSMNSCMEWRRVLTILKEQMLNSDINPLPYTRFDAVNIQDALLYLQKAKHIGKVVCVMPEFQSQENGERHIHTPLFHSNATYLITGGLGGIGLAVCKWMLKMGAKYILLVGRNPPTSKASSTITAMNEEFNSNVQYVPLDVSSFQQCEHLINVKISEMGYPTLRGVMHAAGSLRDGLVANQTWEVFSEPLGAKINGTINLHELTKNNQKMEHFVWFSSAVTCVGFPGQSNHSAGNQFEDMFAHYRHSIGLPATSINWGQWGEVGIATEYHVHGIKSFSTLQALAGLEYALKSQRPQTAVVNIESFSTLMKRCPNILNYINEITVNLHPSVNIPTISQANQTLDEFLKKYNSLGSSVEKQEMFKEKVRSILHQILKLDSSDSIDDNMDFEKMGVDSLMFVEISNSLKSFFADRLPLTGSTLRESSNVALLSKVLVQLMDENVNVSTENLPTFQQVNALIKEDCGLLEFIRAKADQNITPADKIFCVLVTGSTGTLGPYVLKELSSYPQITEILCLIRPGRKISGIERLKKILLDRDLQASVDMSKIKCVDGNVASSKLGMDPALWEDLCDRVDAVVHCAASVQHVQQYTKGNSGADSMRSVNIQGTKNVLEFACSGSKLKHVFHASTYFAVVKTNEQGYLSEDWPEPDDYNDSTTLAYPNTKFVGDVLMKKAILERGIPGKVFRFPMITGDSKTGRFVLDSNHMMLRYIFILQNGIIQEEPFPTPILPVDICAWASIQLFLNPSVPNDVYNVIDSPPFVDQEFIEIAKKFGCNIDIVNYSTFAEKVRELTITDTLFAMFKDLYRGEDFLTTAGVMAWLPHWMSLEDSQKDFMTSKKIRKYLPEFYNDKNSAADRLYRDLLFANAQGWIEKHTK